MCSMYLQCSGIIMVHTLPLVEDELLYPRAYIDSAGSQPITHVRLQSFTSIQDVRQQALLWKSACNFIRKGNCLGICDLTKQVTGINKGFPPIADVLLQLLSYLNSRKDLWRKEGYTFSLGVLPIFTLSGTRCFTSCLTELHFHLVTVEWKSHLLTGKEPNSGSVFVYNTLAK